jgi:hypothetical protein
MPKERREIEAVRDRARKAWSKVMDKHEAALKVALETKRQLVELDLIIEGPKQKQA